MKVKDVVKLLLAEDQEAECLIHDADTDWSLGVHVGYGPYGRQKDIETGKWDDTVYIYGMYGDERAP